MDRPLRTLSDDAARYQRSFQLFLECSTEHKSMDHFIHSTLPGVLSSVGDGSSPLRVIGVGSGTGEMDLEMLSELHETHPGALVENEVVEPNKQFLHKYQALVSQKRGLDYVKFKWNNMTALEFEEQRGATKKADYIHMIQMLYYVKDPGATIQFYRSLLNKNGKLLIILVSEHSGWGKLWRTFGTQLCAAEISQCVTTGELKKLLDSMGASYQSYELPSQFDITECFAEGDEKGDLLLDFLTEVQDFRRTSSPKLKAEVLEMLRHPDCSVESNGRVIFSNNLGALVLGPLT